MADELSQRAQALVAQPAESLDTEIKSWLDLSTQHGRGHVVRAALAMRNYGGGHILFGFNDETRLPEPAPPGWDVRRMFHSGIIQALVGGYASKLFELAVEFGERDGQLHPVLFARVTAGYAHPRLKREFQCVIAMKGRASSGRAWL